MDISRYLAELIRSKRELVVPGLGKFYREQIPASYDANSQSFLPPAERIVFKNEAVEDGTLVQHISQSENISINAAKKLLEEYTSNLHDLLSNTELIKIDQLGSFEKSENGFAFEADPGLVSNPYFGLKPQSEPSTATQIAVENIVSVNETADKVEMAEEESEEEISSGSKGKIGLLILAVLLSIIAGLQVFYPQAFDLLRPEQPENNQTMIPPVQTDTIPVIDTTVLDSSLVTDTPKVIAAPIISDAPTYEIVIAAFGKRSEADNFMQQLAQRGITARALPNRKKEYIKISVGSFSDQQQAQQELQRIQRELSKGAWIYKVKPLKQTINVSPTN